MEIKGFTEKELKIVAKDLNLKYGFVEHFINKLKENRQKYSKHKNNCPFCKSDDIFEFELTHYKCRKCKEQYTN